MKRIVASSLAAIALVGGFLVLSQAAFGAPEASTPVKYVDMKNKGANTYLFTPKTITIKVGTKVVWRNRSNAAHDVKDKASKPTFDSGLTKLIQPKQQYSFTFHHAGTYTYYCVIHPYMVGKIIVKK